MPPAFLLVGVARYAYQFGLWWEQPRGVTIQPLPESDLRRPIAGVMMVFSSALLWPIVPIPAARIAGLVVGLPFLLGFARDYLVVSGHLSPTSAIYLRWRARSKRILKGWAPPVLRGLVLLAWGLAAASVFFIYEQYLIRDRDPKLSFRAFLNNHYFGMTVFIGLAVDYLLN